MRKSSKGRIDKRMDRGRREGGGRGNAKNLIVAFSRLPLHSLVNEGITGWIKIFTLSNFTFDGRIFAK